ncbi:DUF4278 domain-containing protein [Nostocaceae cyanobacterium CENA357]|uniref:DUF4278 domain-containing protein n=1 Tax=Atlanticothrix silvestris CENA357 TaxID=1725252 RepID=A0A8J7HET5_9CYAN|nr:DUF4278 domain-containing protein [Atlanticothrix silvestris]MBH8551151.1 DUF4278 domain-containing protein [Atlanticothrix silvestris CENA357]
MQLHYRGQSYEYNPGQTEQILQTDRNLIYRGAFYGVNGNIKSAKVYLATTDKLIYRGNH